MKENELSAGEYLFDYLFCALIAYVWYQNLIFINIERLSVLKSNLILIGMILVLFLVNTFLIYDLSCNMWTIIASNLIPMGIYTFITYRTYLSNIFYPILWVAASIIVISLCIIPFTKVRSKKKRKRRQIRRKRGLEAVKGTLALCSSALIVCIFVRTYVAGALVSSQDSATATYGDEYTIANNIDTLIKLKPENWKKIDSAQERLNILQCLVNVEGNYFGLTKEIHIYSKLMREGLMAYYSDREAAVYINVDLLMKGSVYQVVESVAHEMFHAGTYRYVEIYNGLSPEEQNSYFLYDASVYAEEFADYVDGEEDYIAYYGQECERQARYYGERAVAEYYKRISELTGDDSFEVFLHDCCGIDLQEEKILN